MSTVPELNPAQVAELGARLRDNIARAVKAPEQVLRDVLVALMAEGRTNRAIAEELVITPHTVEKHVTSVLGKLRIPATADDHRRVLAVLMFLDSD